MRKIKKNSLFFSVGRKREEFDGSDEDPNSDSISENEEDGLDSLSENDDEDNGKKLTD